MTDIRVCAQDGFNSEYTLCGDAFDAFATGDAVEDHECAPKGGIITCPQCCKVIQDVREMRYRLKPRDE